MQISMQKAVNRMQNQQDDFIGFSTAGCLLLSAYCLLKGCLIWTGITY